MYLEEVSLADIARRRDEVGWRVSSDCWDVYKGCGTVLFSPRQTSDGGDDSRFKGRRI